MANHPIRMSLLKQIISLKEKGQNHRQISSQLSCSRKTVNKYVAMWQSAGSPPADTPSFQSLLTKPIEELIPFGRIFQLTIDEIAKESKQSWWEKNKNKFAE